MKNRLLTIIIVLLLTVCSMGAVIPNEDFNLEFVCNGEIIKYNDVKYVADNHIIYEEISKRKINASLNEKKREILRLIEDGMSEKDAVLTCFPSMSKTFETVSKKVLVNAMDSRIAFNPNKDIMFSISKERCGVSADESAFYADVVHALFSNKRKITVKTERIMPTVGVEDNKQYLYKKSLYSTSLSTSSPNRKHNVEKALSSINGTVLQKGEVLSFNTKTGIRSEENGYKTAKIIVGNEYVDGVGGGVCQASTTLYNSALLAGLEVLSVSSHSLLPSYVEPSFDAMVNMGSSDLVIKNNSGGPVFIKATVKDNVATVIIYGRKNDYEIRRKSVTVSKGKIPDDKKVYDSENKYFSGLENVAYKRISYSQPQLKSEGYLVYYKDGIKQKEVKIREDEYNSKSGIIAYRVEKKNDMLFFCINI